MGWGRDLTGFKFGQLTVTGQVKSRPRYWACLCECGNYSEVLDSNLPRTKSCGCYKGHHVKNGASFSVTGRSTRTHGLSNSKEYQIWRGIKTRCFNTKREDYANYGGRGITMSDRWKNSFTAFLEDMGTRPSGMTIDRIDNDGDYKSGNCRWATPLEQNNNRRWPRKRGHSASIQAVQTNRS